MLGRKSLLLLLTLSSCAFAQKMPLVGVGKGNAGGAAPTRVQGCGNFLSGTQGSIVATCGSNFVAGHFLLICVSSIGAVTITWTGDSGTFTADPGATTPITNKLWNGSSLSATCVYVPSAGGGGNTITATSGSLNFPAITVEEWTAATFDKSDDGVVSGSPSTSVSSNAITPTNNNSVLLGVIMANSGPTITPGTSVAWQAGATNTSTALVEFFSQTTAASILADATLGSSQQSFAHIFAIH